MDGTARVLVVWLAVGLLALGCGADEEEPMTETPAEQVAQLAAERLDVSAGAIEVGPPTELDGSGCQLFTARDAEAPGAVPEHYVVLADGTVVEGPNTASAVMVLNACFADVGSVPSADAVAELVVRLADPPGPMAVLSSGWARDRLAEQGVDDVPPTLIEGDDGYTVTFLAEDLELDVVSRVTATRSDDGTLRLSFEEL